MLVAQPELALQVAKAVFVGLPVPVEVHCAVLPPLEQRPPWRRTRERVSFLT